MTNKKFKKAAMALALTACVAATPLAANAETPENAVPVENKERFRSRNSCTTGF